MSPDLSHPENLTGAQPAHAGVVLPRRRILSVAVSQMTWYRYVVVLIYGLPIMTFTMPGRPSPSDIAFLDQLAVVKALILAFSVSAGIILLYVNRNAAPFRHAINVLIPFFLFLAWAITTVLWSPLRSVSLGQAGGLCALLFFCTTVASLCSDKLYMSRILKHLCYCLNGFGLLILMVYCVDPAFSGLDRSVLLQGGDGIVHPTAAGAAASLGLLIAACSFVIGRFPWATSVFWISVAVNGPLLILSNSRAAILMAAVTIPVVLFRFGSVRSKGMVMLGLAIASVGYLLFDPGFNAVQDTIGSSVRYLSRGQDVEQLRAVSGRTEMWSAVWHEYRHAKFVGHGYFVTSPNGRLDVWDVANNHTAHNIYLQILVSTGLVGFVLFLVAMIRVMAAIACLRRCDLFSQHLYWIFGLIVIWYLGWTFGCISFMGPVRPESVVFFAIIGIGIGNAYRMKAVEALPVKVAR